MNENENLFWEANVEEITNGFKYFETEGKYVCLLCHEIFQEGFIYENQNLLLEAKKAVEYHIQDVHGSIFDYLINLNKKYTGLTETQTELLKLFQQGLSDKDIAAHMGGANSTIRAHRFKLKEKEKQAKVFLAIMTLLNQESKLSKDEFVPIHRRATMVDERYKTTNEEQEKILKTYFKEGLDGPLHIFPSKEKRKIIVLKHIISKFAKDELYTEKEVNEKLKQIYADFVTIRRYLIEYGFMDRSKDGSQYWVKQ